MFYASFGFMVTSSVPDFGVLLVFCYLIVPSVAAMLYADRVLRGFDRLDHGHGRLGPRHLPSVRFDLPKGAAMVCTFGLVLVLMAAVRPVLRRATG